MHGNYIAKRDVLHHSSPREMLQSAQLIGKETDDQSLDVYSSNLLLLYILNELQYLPNSMCRTDTYIPLVQRLFDDVIIQNKFSDTEHPYTMVGLQTSLTNSFNEFWRDNTRKQLQSIYKDCQDSPDIPTRGEVERVTRFSQCHWDPLTSPSLHLLHVGWRN